MTWFFQKFFHVHHRITKGSTGFVLCHGNRFDELAVASHDSHASPTTTASGLDDDRVTNLVGQFPIACWVITERTITTRDTGHTSRFHFGDGTDLVTHQPDNIGGGANEFKAAVFDAFGKVGVLGQKAITRMYRFCARDFRSADDGRYVQITVGRCGRTDTHSFIGKANMFQISVSS